MKRNFTNENFEDFLRQNAEGLRMRPSGQVWKSISKQLNKRRRRVGFAIGTFLLALSTFGYFVVQDSVRKINSFAQASPAASASQTNKSSGSNLAQQVSPQKPGIPQSILTAQSSSHKENTVSTTIFSPLAENKDALTEEDNKQNERSNNPMFEPTIVDSYFDEPSETKINNLNSIDDKSLLYPQTIESATNSYKAIKYKKKLGLQLYFTPTISYRKLAENKSFLRSQSANNPSYMPALIFDVNNMVTHKPDIGFEMGLAAKYPITKKMKLRGGLQFNVNRYDIKAYNAVTSVTTIMFNARTANNRADSLNTYTRYSNSNTTGYKTDWLQNYYIQISAPVGVEFKVSGDDKLQFGIATTIQPTYVLGDRAYLISTDYKRYAEVPQLVRRWNVNTSLETFVGYSTGRLDWQVGPQVRYQLLSSFINKYPVKENLFDFGLKVGVSLNK